MNRRFQNAIDDVIDGIERELGATLADEEYVADGYQYHLHFMNPEGYAIDDFLEIAQDYTAGYGQEIGQVGATVSYVRSFDIQVVLFVRGGANNLIGM
jgi:hypothetical protein